MSTHHFESKDVFSHMLDGGLGGERRAHPLHDPRRLHGIARTPQVNDPDLAASALARHDESLMINKTDDVSFGQLERFEDSDNGRERDVAEERSDKQRFVFPGKAYERVGIGRGSCERAISNDTWMPSGERLGTRHRANGRDDPFGGGMRDDISWTDLISLLPLYLRKKGDGGKGSMEQTGSTSPSSRSLCIYRILFSTD
jgi:hypothetical protein